MKHVFESNEEAILAEFDDLFLNENPMFDVYQKMASFFNVDLTFAELDLELFKKLKYMITRLVLVKPKDRMKLEEAKEKLKELEDFMKTKKIKNFLLLNHFLQNDGDPTMTNTDETTQNSLRLMNEIRSTRLFTIPTTGTDKKLTQRLTNLCVAVTAMRLLSYALIDFLEPHCKNNPKDWDELKKTILKFPDNPQSSKKSQEERDNANIPVYVPGTSKDAPDGYPQGLKPAQKEKSNLFIQQLITICCGVISPRSLNGLNHCYLDDDFHIAAQEQNIR